LTYTYIIDDDDLAAHFPLRKMGHATSHRQCIGRQQRFSSNTVSYLLGNRCPTAGNPNRCRVNSLLQFLYVDEKLALWVIYMYELALWVIYMYELALWVIYMYELALWVNIHV